MVYYVRFLKSPKIQEHNLSSLSVSALICITTDLGDSFLPDDVELKVTLAVNETNAVLLEKCIQWQAGKRELRLSLGPFHRQLCKQAVVLGVGAAGAKGVKGQSPSHCRADELVDKSTIPLILSGWSTPFGGPQRLQTEKLVERRFNLQREHDLRIWEETGNSIARHIWDAALASIICLQRATEGRAQSMPSLQQLLQKSSSPLHVVELGSGCGIVGIALAELLPRCSVLLTDLPEVNDIVTHNLAVAHPAPQSVIDFKTLDWDEQPSEDITRPGVDLILVSDCTYNADSLPSLVHVLGALVQTSPEALVLVALKRRHDSEAVFFDLMHGAAFGTLDRDTIPLPSFGFGQDPQIENVEIYAFRREGKANSG